MEPLSQIRAWKNSLKKNNSVDVVIPTYRRGRLAYEAVLSVLEQTHSELNLYVIEDGSPDFLPFAKKLASEDPRFHYVSLRTNQGVSYARNSGACLGNGEFISFLDSDDLWSKVKLQEQLAFLEKNPSIYWVHCDETWLRNGVEVRQKNRHRKQGGSFVVKLLERCLISPSAVLFRRNFWEGQAVGFLKHLRVAEDYEMWLRLNLVFEIGFVNKALVKKRAGGWEQLSQRKEIDRERVLALRRFYLLHKNQPKFKAVLPFWEASITKKIKILQKGALKHGHHEKFKEYQSWEILDNIDRTALQL